MVRKHSEPLDEPGVSLLAVPGGTDGPGGVLLRDLIINYEIDYKYHYFLSLMTYPGKVEPIFIKTCFSSL